MKKSIRFISAILVFVLIISLCGCWPQQEGMHTGVYGYFYRDTFTRTEYLEIMVINMDGTWEYCEVKTDSTDPIEFKERTKESWPEFNKKYAWDETSQSYISVKKTSTKIRYASMTKSKANIEGKTVDMLVQKYRDVIPSFES